ncbi:flagellar biosynthetic protein FliO [Diaminobutyricibacter sp. McL0608]|uniref:flagellar biosynthetic protein FliO n=1 Tax=Leifsonia sp. McL0608 TaxID=3143537 RepID=UPI0031F30E4B
MDAVLTMLRVVVSLAAVLGVIWYLHRRVSKRQLGTKKKQNPVVVVGKQGIAGKASVVVVDVDGRRLVLGVTEHSVNVLHSAEQVPVAAVAFEAAMAEADAVRPDAVRPNAVGADALDEDAKEGSRMPAPATASALATSGASAAPAPASAVAGSILAASTWKLALSSVRNGLK